MKDLQTTIIRALVESRTDEATKALETIAKQSPAEIATQIADISLRIERFRELRPFLSDFEEQYPSENTFRFHLYSLSELAKDGIDTAVDLLIEISEDQSAPSSVRFDAIQMMGRIPDNKRICESFIKLLGDELCETFSDFRTSVLRKLDRCGTPEVLPTLFEYLFEVMGSMDFFWGSEFDVALSTIAAIQNRCQFYNYEIFQNPPTTKAVIDQADYAPLLDNLQQIKQGIREMTETPSQDFSGATFNAPVNFGHNNQGDFIGVQNNYAPDSKTIEAYGAISKFLQDLRQKYPQASEQELLEILAQGFESMPTRNAQRWQQWKDVFSVAFAGGVEAIKIVAPQLGIPIEVAKRLYEIYDRNRKSLPGK